MTKNYPVKSASELYSQADKILENFNFERVHDHMKYTKWSWYNGDGEYGVPSVEQLKQTANQLLLGVISNGEEVGMHATGGLQAIKFPWGLTLNFIYEHSEG
jgi:hypothetical protein